MNVCSFTVYIKNTCVPVHPASIDTLADTVNIELCKTIANTSLKLDWLGLFPVSPATPGLRQRKHSWKKNCEKGCSIHSKHQS